MNYFAFETAAERYVKGRPDFHGNTISHIRKFLQIDGKLHKALDVGCGTGLSTKALLAIAEEVYGTDLSPEMLSIALEKDKIYYTVAAAESQPFEDNEFDLLTVSSAIHWFNIEAFLTEANRLLKTNRWLAIYENYFPGEMAGNDHFTKWVNTVYYQQHFPAPQRNNKYDWSTENLLAKGFNIQTPAEFKNAVSFRKQQLVDYFMTQSNIIAAVESGASTYKKAEQWLDQELAAFFKTGNEEQIVYFGNRLKYLQKI